MLTEFLLCQIPPFIKVDLNVNGHEHFWGSRYENIMPTDIGSGQSLEIILRDIWNKPSRNTGGATLREKRSSGQRIE